MNPLTKEKWRIGRKAVLALVLAAATGASMAAGVPPAGDWANPGGGAGQNRKAASREEALFVEKCSMCHREKGMGTVILARRLPPAQALLENRTDLNEPFVRLAVRTGIGNMPRITRGEVSDDQLGIIIKYLLGRHHDG